MATAASIDVTGLTKVHPDGCCAITGVDLAVMPGELVALVGSNGAGKSTLLRCLVRLLEPTAGRVLIDGTDVTAARQRVLRKIRTDVGFVFQRFHLVTRLTAFQNVLHGAVGRRGARCLWPLTAPDEVRDEAMGCLRRVGLAGAAQRRVDTLSGGQQQRVAIARMLLQQPRVILADEPVASLDPVAGLGVMELLGDIVAERKLTAIVALHQVELALKYCQRVVGLQDGQVVLDRPAPACGTEDLDRVYAQVES